MSRSRPAQAAGAADRGGGRPSAGARRQAVVCLSISPAVQRTLSFERFQTDAVNRALATVVSVGGKGVNTALALARLRRASVVTGLNGGDTGAYLEAFLKARGVTCAFPALPGRRALGLDHSRSAPRHPGRPRRDGVAHPATTADGCGEPDWQWRWRECRPDACALARLAHVRGRLFRIGVR